MRREEGRKREWGWKKEMGTSLRKWKKTRAGGMITTRMCYVLVTCRALHCAVNKCLSQLILTTTLSVLILQMSL